MRKVVIKCSYLAVVFLISLVVISAAVNKGNAEMTMEMGPATFPVVNMYYNGSEVNELHGYSTQMAGGYQRDSITPLEEGRKASLILRKYGQQINALSFEVRSIDGERLIENTVIKNYTEEGDSIKADFTVKDLIEEDQEYMLVLLVELEYGSVIRYYTRISQSDHLYAKEKMEYVLDFHEKIFHKEEAEALTKYLESNADGDNTSYSRVTINSSFQQVTWGDLQVERVTDPQITFKELAEQTGNFELRYLVSIKEGNRDNFYSISEFYRIRYTSDRIYLLDYERIMRQIFDENADVFANNKIQLGITSSESIELVESDGGNIFAFTDSGRLYAYNNTDKKLARLFGFYGDGYGGERELWPKHDIKILNVDEAGNVDFIVYGYMNRGRREGSLGIEVYHYSGPMNTVEEMAFIPSDKSYELLKADMQQLAYLNKNGIFFFIYDGGFYRADMQSRDSELIVSKLREGSYQVSDSNKMVVWQNGEDVYGSDKLVVMNLNSQQTTEIAAQSGEKIAPLGFIGEDLIYGLAREEDIAHDAMGNIVFPMYKVLIQSENNEILKTYQEDNAYIVSSEVRANQVDFKRVAKEVESGNYVEIENYQFLNTKPDSGSNNVVETVVTESFQKILQIAVKEPIDEKALKRLTPKEVLFEGGREIILEKDQQLMERYYVYGKNGVEGIFTDEGNAVNLAYDISGIVVNDRGAYVWMRGNRNLKNQIMAIKEKEITEEKSSLAVCLDTMLNYEGIMRNTEYMIGRGETVRTILENNNEEMQVLDLAGCSLDAILYYVDKDIPVLAYLGDGTAVLIIGFNELNTVIMDPLTGTIYKKGMNDSKVMFEESGNKFITYIRVE